MLIALATIIALAVPGCSLLRRPTSEQAAPPPAESTGIADDRLVVAISGMVTPKEGLTYYKGLSEYIGRKVGRKVRLIHKADYSELNALLEEGRVDIAYSCSGPYASGHDEFGLQLVAAPVVNGSPTYRAYIITSKSDDATSLASFRGKTFAFTDPKSNTGCLVPTYMLARMGTAPDEFFGRVVYTYSHDNSIEQVAKGTVDGASVDSLIWDYLHTQGSSLTRDTRIVATSERFGIPPVVARPGLSKDLLERIRAAYLGADKDPEGRRLLKKMNMDRFVTIDDSDYDSIRRMDAWIKSHNAKD
jgi:phosphonate transport system substrate-binding protein